MFKETKRKGFNFFRSYYDVFNELETDKDKLAFITALLDRQFLGVKPEGLKGLVKFAWISQVNSIDSQVKGYEDKTNTKLTPCLGGSERGKIPPAEQVEEKVEEKVEVQDVKPAAFKTQNEFLEWFNKGKEYYTKSKGKTKTLSKTDINNFKKLNEVYNRRDWGHALKMLTKSDWAIKENMIIPAHFLRIDNFTKYLNQEDKEDNRISLNQPVN